MSRAVGVDLGATDSAVAVLDGSIDIDGTQDTVQATGAGVLQKLRTEAETATELSFEGSARDRRELTSGCEAVAARRIDR